MVDCGCRCGCRQRRQSTRGGVRYHDQCRHLVGRHRLRAAAHGHAVAQRVGARHGTRARVTGQIKSRGKGAAGCWSKASTLLQPAASAWRIGANAVQYRNTPAWRWTQYSVDSALPDSRPNRNATQAHLGFSVGPPSRSNIGHRVGPTHSKYNRLAAVRSLAAASRQPWALNLGPWTRACKARSHRC
jgi:hypothetical protein